MTKKTEAKKIPVISKYELPERRVLIYKEGEDNEPPVFVHLRHPHSHDKAMFIFTDKNSVVQEILKCNDNKRSFLIGNTVSSNGDLCIATPVDPLFLVLPYLKKMNRCCPLDHILMDDELPETERLLSCSGLKNLDQIADKRGDDSLNAYIYNEEKTMKWLEKKVKKLSEALKEQSIHVSSSSSTSANFVKTQNTQDSEESYLRYALGIVSDYLPENVANKLAEFLNLPEEIIIVETNKNKRTDMEGENEESKRVKVDEEIENSPSVVNRQETKQEKDKKTSVKMQAMAKAAKGTKNISSFFKKKD